jgi:hypothetical protein
MNHHQGLQEETDRMLVEVEKIIHPKWKPIAEERVRKWAFITEPNRGDYLIQLKKIVPRLVTILLMRLE